MDIKDQLDICRQILNKADTLAARWMKAVDPYYNVYKATICFRTNKINFSGFPITSGCPWNMSIDIKYLEDDTNLERDAKIWHDNYKAERNRLACEMAKLKDTDDQRKDLQRQIDILNGNASLNYIY